MDDEIKDGDAAGIELTSQVEGDFSALKGTTKKVMIIMKVK